jgi:NAD(P)-dependent dehydrogenase (short-subunit alcohol dehydrogenase family)
METASAEPTTSLTALVTAAMAGLGFEAAVLLTEQGYGPVIVRGHSLARAAEAKNELVKKTGRRVFVALEADLGDSTNVAAVGEELARSGHKIDALILNARAMSGNGMVPTDDGIELMMAS